MYYIGLGFPQAFVFLLLVEIIPEQLGVGQVIYGH